LSHTPQSGKTRKGFERLNLIPYRARKRRDMHYISAYQRENQLVGHVETGQERTVKIAPSFVNMQIFPEGGEKKEGKARFSDDAGRGRVRQLVLHRGTKRESGEKKTPDKTTTP